MTKFDPNAAATSDSGIFGLPFSVEEAKLILLPVTWEATTSYGGGTANGPDAIFHASKQVDLFDVDFGNFYEAGIAMIKSSQEVRAWNELATTAARKVIDGELLSDQEREHALHEVNTHSLSLNHYVYTETKRLLDQGKIVGIVGGDHSVPFGAMKALLEKYPQMGVLHIDAHADMRQAYEGFEFSHASIMYNVITKTSLSKLVQIGIRDFCEEEFNFIKTNKGKIYTFFDSELCDQKMQGKTWSQICDEVIQHLPQEVYISFDIDGLDPRFCPHTGTPVPGGLDFNEAVYLLKKIQQSGRKIVGFDLNEVSLGTEATLADNPASEWDANVGARLLYKMCALTLVSARNGRVD